MKPIIFSTPMVQAILKGEKTQTRRIVKFNKEIRDPQIGWTAFTRKGYFSVRGTHKNGEYGESFFKMKYEVGDILWVRETFSLMVVSDFDGYGTDIYRFLYKADTNDEDILSQMEDAKWKPSIYMPFKATRIYLKVTRVSLERLNDISSTDAINEGIDRCRDCDTNEELYYFYPCNDLRDDSWLFSSKTSFYSLWKSINGNGSWEKNPWVWVYEFKKIEKEEIE